MKYVKGIFYYCWKLYIGLIFIVTLLLFYPFLFICINIASLKKATFRINIVWSNAVRILCFYRIKKNLNPSFDTPPYIIIANHTSYLDIFLMYCVLPKNKFLFMGKSEILKYPLVKTFFKGLNIPVDRNSKINSGKAFVQAKKEIENGWSIVIFPEGGIFNNAPTVNPFKDGPFLLAKTTKSPILSFTYKNNHRLFSDPSDFFGSARPGTVLVYFHPVIDIEDVEKLSINVLKEKTHAWIASKVE